MNHAPTLKLNFPPTSLNAQLAHYQDLRARFRLAIRHQVSKFKGRFPRQFHRYVPTLEPSKFTEIDPGQPDLTMYGLVDNQSFGSLHWARSGKRKVRNARGILVNKIQTVRRHSTAIAPPWIREIVEGNFSYEEAERVRTAMCEINALVKKYRDLHEGFLTLLEVAHTFDCQQFDEVLGEHRPRNPMAGLPSRQSCRHLKLKAEDNYEESKDSEFVDEE